MKSSTGIIITAFIAIIAFYIVYDALNIEHYLPPEPAFIGKPLNIGSEQEKVEVEKTDKQEGNPPLPDLESFEGLEQESDNISDIVEGLPTDNSSDDPLKDLLQ